MGDREGEPEPDLEQLLVAALEEIADCNGERVPHDVAWTALVEYRRRKGLG